jgi:hypothetical protein
LKRLPANVQILKILQKELSIGTVRLTKTKKDGERV